MPKRRSYKLLCPISRALDRVGDRWTLLILRDLLAGPARFTELQRGLTGIAANLLTDRLAALVDDGLVTQRDGGHGVMVYALTDLGEQTSDIIFELARFGARLGPVSDVIAPGNLRTVATTLGAAAKRAAAPEMNFVASILVDEEAMQLSVRDGEVRMEYNKTENPDLTFQTTYAALLDVTEGVLSPEDFQQQHSQLDAKSAEKAEQFATLLAKIMQVLKN